MARDERFGHSLALVGGDLVFDEQPDGTRVLREVRGAGNLLQALKLRVETPLGDDRFNTTYGLDYAQIFAQAGGIQMTKEVVRLNLVRTLGTDPRVRDVREIAFEDEPEFQARHPEVRRAEVDQARRRRSWRVDVVIETVEGEAAAVPLELGG
jgi:hypothetical protein